MCGNIYTASAWRLIRFMIWDSTESAVWDAPWQGRTAGQSFDYSRPTNGHIYDPFGKMLDAIHAGGGKTKWKTAEDVFSWWMEEKTIEGQMSLFDRTEWLEKEKDELFWKG